MEDIKLICDSSDLPRLDKYLAIKLSPDYTRSQLQMMIENNDVLVNDNCEKSNFKLKLNDIITIKRREAVACDILPQDIPLDIYYEDSDIIVINKPAGMVVHPAVGNLNNTVVNALMFHCKDLSGINGKIRAGIVHRIDKDTSGLMIACKNDKAHKKMSDEFFNHEVKKVYYAICYGVIPHNNGRIDAPIGRDPVARQQMAVVENGKSAVTSFKVLERFKNYTLVELSLETGRTHQIRVHMKYIGYPLVGDPLYGPKKVIGTTGQMLHSRFLEFKHPITGEDLKFSCPLPDYFEEFLNQIRAE